MPAFYNGQAYAVAETEIAIGREITKGTPPSGGPSYAIPVKGPKYKPNLMILPDQTLQGSMVETYQYVTGIRDDTHGWSAPPYLDSFPLFLMGEFGSPDKYTAVTVTGVTLSTSTVGSAAITVSASTFTNGMWITFGSNANGTVETHQIASGGGSTSLTLSSPVLFTQVANAAITQLSKHQFSVQNSGLGTTYNGATTAVSALTTITVLSTTGFFSSGQIQVNTSVGAAIFTYTGLGGSGTTFTGCTFVSQTGGTGNGVVGALVTLIGSQPPSFTLWDFDGEEWREMTAMQLDELTIKGNGTGLVEYTCTWMGNPATPNISPPTVSYTGKQSPAPWSFYTLLGGNSYASNYVPTVTEWEFDFKRGVKGIPALTGQQQYFSYFAGPQVATGKLTFVEQPGSPQLNAYLNALEQAFDFTIFDQVAGAALNIHSSNAQFITGELDRTGDYATTPVEFGFLPTTTDATAGGESPCILTVANSVASAY
jgi:hypothetical protein